MPKRQAALGDYEKRAVQALNSGHLALAEMLAWSALERQSNSPTGLSVLAAVAARIGLAQTGLDFLSQAASIDPTLPNLDSNRVALQQLAAARSNRHSTSGNNRYLLIRAWGCGFWSDASYVAIQSLLAELTHRVPVVHWGYGSLYSDNPRDDAFSMFFEPLSDLTANDLAKMEGRTFPSWWSRELLADPPAAVGGPSSGIPASHFLAGDWLIAVSDYFTSMSALRGWMPRSHPLASLSLRELWQRQISVALRPLARFERAMQTYVRELFEGRPYLAVHCRQTDKSGETLSAGYLPWSESCIAKWTNELGDIPIFVLTDQEAALRHYTARYGDRIRHTRARRSKSDLSVQHDTSIADRRGLGEEVLIDAMVAGKAVAFAGLGWSNLSCTIAYQRPWPAGRCELFGEAMFDGVVKTIYSPTFSNRSGSRPLLVAP